MEGVSAADPTLLLHDRLWWLFTTIKEYEGASHDDELFLFYAESPITRNWTPHPENPVISDVRRARPAGRILVKDGRLLRPAQDSSWTYGYGLNLQEIVTLTPTEYEERTVSTLGPHWDSRIEGVHSLAHDGALTIVDAIVRQGRFR